MRSALDTNILVYAVSHDDDPRCPRARDLIDTAASGDTVLPLQVLGELSHVMLRKHAQRPAVVRRYIDRLTEVFPVILANLDTYHLGLDACEQHQLSFWDAQLWAVCHANGVRVLYSEDMHAGRRLGQVDVVNPFEHLAA